MGKKGNKGLALISVIVMIILISSIIFTVVLSATISIRRANLYKDKLIAYEVAEAGIQEILYRLNYHGYKEDDEGTEWKRASWIGSNLQSSTVSIPKWYNDLISSKGFSLSDLNKYETDILFPEFGRNVKSTIYFIDINSSTLPETDLDLIISKGSYNGRTVTISFLLRGAGEIKQYASNFWYGDFSDKNTNRTKGNPGIAEAFNKHVIYAKTLSFPASPTGINIKGNITAETISSKPPFSQATWTETTIDLSDMVHFETSVCSFSIPSDPGIYNDTYTNNGMLINATYPGGVSVNSSPDPAPGVYWTGSQYRFGIANDGSSAEDFNSNGRTILVNASITIPNNAGNVTIDSYFKTTNTLTINKNITTPTNDTDFCLDVGGTLTITSGISISGDLIVRGQTPTFNMSLNNNINGKVACEGSITINGGTIGGDLLSSKNITLTSGTINGSVVCYSIFPTSNAISISGGTINATNSNYDAAVYIHNSVSGSTESETIIISGSSITLGQNQKAGICIVAPNGKGNINITGNFTLNYPPDLSDQFAIVNYCSDGNVNITANNLNLRRGSIYSFKNISLDNNTQRITGIFIGGGTFAIGNNTTLTYDPAPYKNNSGVYKGFVRGRRKYLPVPGSWRIEW